MLAFILVFSLLLIFQVGRNVQIVSDQAVRLRQEIAADQAEVTRLVDDLRKRHGEIGIRAPDGSSQEITFGGSTLFDSGSADLHGAGKVILARLVQSIVDAHLCTLREITVKGHTDDVRIFNGRYESNWELSAIRATRVVRFLTEAHQGRRINPERVTLVAAAYGEHSPIATDKERNRRIEMRLVYTNRSCAPQTGARAGELFR